MYTEPGSVYRVPNAPKNPTHSVRFENGDWADLGEMTAEMGTDRSKVITQLIRWWMRRPDAELPERPPASQHGE